MRCRLFLFFLVSIMPGSLLLFAQTDEDRWDWRKALLTEEGIALTPEAWQKIVEAREGPEEGLPEIIGQLGDESFAKREETLQRLLKGGDQLYRWLRDQPPHADPEIRRRLQKVEETLAARPEVARLDALDHALRSLLADGDQPSPDTGGFFYEWFGEDRAEIEKRYHQLQFRDSSGRGGKVSGGRLELPGPDGREGDQRMILNAPDWPGREHFGEHFLISARAGGTDRASGSWHLGITVGKVRALYHPGFAGGEFRFSFLETTTGIRGPNRSMPFTPGGDPPEQITLEVKKIPGNQVSLSVTVRQGGPEPEEYSDTLVIAADKIGPLSQISLDRSGRSGGDAFFTDFTVTLLPED